MQFYVLDYTFVMKTIQAALSWSVTAGSSLSDSEWHRDDSRPPLQGFIVSISAFHFNAVLFFLFSNAKYFLSLARVAVNAMNELEVSNFIKSLSPATYFLK